MKAKWWEKICHANINWKEVGIAILTSDKLDFRAKSINKEGHYLMIKESMHQEAIAILDVYIYQTTKLKNLWSKNW